MQKYTHTIICVLLCFLTFAPNHIARACIIFDSFTPPISWGGFSSANGGLATQLSFSQDVEITGFSIMNRMLADGDLKFLILGDDPYDILFSSASVSYQAEAETSWKRSPEVSFTFLGGETYLVGYARDVATDDYVEGIAESYDGITSDLYVAALLGFETPTYSHHVFTGVDSPVRLHAIPEPSPIPLILSGIGVLYLRKRNVLAQKWSVRSGVGPVQGVVNERTTVTGAGI
jgi:hypothetical protein